MLIRQETSGLYCEQGGFYIDPTKGVDRAVITHAHADHARRGSKHYLCATACEPLLKSRLGKKWNIQSLPYGESVDINGVKVSLHPAGHILGSSQIRVEYRGEVWVVSGDYKTTTDPTCTPFEPVTCHTFISECTFGFPLFRWPSPDHEWKRLKIWWERNREAGLTSVVQAYSLGKAQRILNRLKNAPAPILIHPSIQELLPAYESQGISFPNTQVADERSIQSIKGEGLILTPQTSTLETWLGHPESWELADVSGWMQIRSLRRKRQLPCGFIVSDHADWDGLNKSIEATEAKQIILTHGEGSVLTEWLSKKGLSVHELAK